MRLVVTGCLVGTIDREPSGEMKMKIKKRLSMVDEFLLIDDVGFEHEAKRAAGKEASVVITHGCNNRCTFCIVPYSRGKETSRPFQDIVAEVKQLVTEGYSEIMLLGQNVNSYGQDLIGSNHEDGIYKLEDGTQIPVVMVKHLGRIRIPAMFPHLLETVCQVDGVQKVTFLSANPWDFSDELIRVIAENPEVNRELHLPVQAGNDEVLKNMKRWYTTAEYEQLVTKIRKHVPGVTLTTDVIVGFPGETEEQFNDTVEFCKRIGFVKGYVACYSPRPGTEATKKLEDTLDWSEKKRRFFILDKVVNSFKHGQVAQK
jgi:tRNA-2-methylthio-N6-dimethylallyladenosine synthase